jgi:hypothetical protein
VPDLSPAGFHRIEGRLLPSEDAPAAPFTYRDGSGERAARIFASGSAARPRFAIMRRAASEHSIGRTKALAMRSRPRADRGLLPRVAELVYRQTSPDSPGINRDPRRHIQGDRRAPGVDFLRGVTCRKCQTLLAAAC